MKREILFRGKRLDTGKWAKGYFIKNYSFNENESALFCAIAFNNDYCQVDPETVSQFTGLTDKNGKKIFEGDIISFSENYEPYNAIVEFNVEDVCSCGCCCSAFQGSGFVGRVIPGSKYNYSCFAQDFNESFVIGNIWDNPELEVKP